MLKFLFYLNIVLSIKLTESRSYGKGSLNDNSVNDEALWRNMWFPHPPNIDNSAKSVDVNVVETAPDYRSKIESERVHTAETKITAKPLFDKNNTSDWPGLYFPMSPGYGNVKLDTQNQLDHSGAKHDCDNGKDNIGADFDPEDKRHSFNYLCIGNRSEYEPDVNTSALLKEYMIPAAYEPPVKCLNENIEYSESIPTFGGFRPLAPKFGVYKYLPPQRFLHSLADGAIVLLYHPCAFAGEIERLQNILEGCLYRHIITPSQQLTPKRPLALMAWGKSLQMSVVDDNIVVKFIKENAKIGFRQKQQNLIMSHNVYDAGLLTEAHLVTDEQDIEICGYKEMR